MKDIETVTLDEKKDELVQFSEKYVLDKNTNLTVPRGYAAIVYVNGKAMYRTNHCLKEKILANCGRECAGQEVQFAFYSPTVSPEIYYGFGPINVNNDRLREAYRIGINGQMILDVKDYSQLINHFANCGSISLEAVREQLLPVIKSVGMSIVGGCFVNNNVSVFEIDSMVGVIREKMFNALSSEPAFGKMGISVASITVNEIFVNEDDLEIIRNRINN